MNREQALETLGVSTASTSDEIQSQYQRQRSKLEERLQTAPDTLKQKFIENLTHLEEAYAVLSSTLIRPQTVQAEDLPLAEKSVQNRGREGIFGLLNKRFKLLSEERLVDGWKSYDGEEMASGEPVTLRVSDQPIAKPLSRRLEGQLSLWASLSHESLEQIVAFEVTEEGVWIATSRPDEARTLSVHSFASDRSALIGTLQQIADVLDYLALDKGHGALSMGALRMSGSHCLVSLPRLEGLIDPNTLRSHYMAPETKRSGIGSERADQYSLGLIAAEWLLQKSLGSNTFQLIEESQLPTKAKMCLKMAVHENPSKRHGNISVFIRELEASLVSCREKALKHPVVIGGLAVALALIVVTLIFGQQVEQFYEEQKQELSSDVDHQMLAIKRIAESKDLIAQISVFRVELEREIERTENYLVRQQNSSRPSAEVIARTQSTFEKLSTQLDFFNRVVMSDDAFRDIKSSLAVIDQTFSAKKFEDAHGLVEPIYQRLRQAHSVAGKLEDIVDIVQAIEVARNRLSGHTLSETSLLQESELQILEQQLAEESDYPALLSQVYEPLLKLYTSELDALENDRKQRRHAENQAYVRSINEELVSVPAGSFKMGIVKAGATDARPVRNVSVATFDIGKHPVTNRQFNVYLRHKGKAESESSESDHPVVNVSWAEAVDFAAWLSRLSGHKYRLPTEAEWEYVARGNSKNTYAWGNSVGRNNANCADCGSQWSGRSTSPVGSFGPNQFGLYDINGNVWEWVQDCYMPNYQNAPNNGMAVEFNECKQRVVRGGAWNTPARKLHPALRSTAMSKTKLNSLGFRIVRER